jgi:cytochrome b561
LALLCVAYLRELFGLWRLLLLLRTPNPGIVENLWASDRNTAGKVSYTVYIIFITIQAAGALVALLLNRPQHVQRQDGKKVQLAIVENPWYEIKATAKAFIRPQFLLIVLWIGQAVFSEAVYFTYLSRKAPYANTVICSLTDFIISSMVLR